MCCSVKQVGHRAFLIEVACSLKCLLCLASMVRAEAMELVFRRMFALGLPKVGYRAGCCLQDGQGFRVRVM